MSAAYAEVEAEVAAQVYDRWTAAMLAMDVDAFLALHTDDVTRAIQDCPVQSGIAAVRAFQAPLMDMLRPIGVTHNAFDASYTLDSSHSSARAMQLVTAFTKQTFQLGNGHQHTTCHLAVMKRSTREGGEWKIHRFVGCTIKDEASSTPPRF